MRISILEHYALVKSQFSNIHSDEFGTAIRWENAKTASYTIGMVEAQRQGNNQESVTQQEALNAVMRIPSLP
jgi:hypothetical protein